MNIRRSKSGHQDRHVGGAPDKKPRKQLIDVPKIVDVAALSKDL